MTIRPATRRRSRKAAAALAAIGAAGAVYTTLIEPRLLRIRRLSVELSWIHLSHARLAGHYNPGVGDVGVRLLYRYGLDR